VSFISLTFLLFFCIVLLLIKIMPTKELQQVVLLISSYIFYVSWDYRFLLLLIILSCGVWFLGKELYVKQKKALLICGIVLCLLVLITFKYFNFFVDNFCEVLKLEGVAIQFILPMGLSFYIFQAISYLCDVYSRKIKSVSLLQVLLYIGFFPQIMSGPIVKAKDFIPQLEQKRLITKENFEIGMQLFVVGLFKKVVIADRLGVCVNAVFSAPMAYSWTSILIAVFANAFQIYYDFSGYSDMAIAVARCMGFDLGNNFNMPYLAKNPVDFWRRWHISLSTWFRDYLYIPLGGNRKGTLRTCLNVFVTMFISGIWHGANWTFWAWGIGHGVISVIYKAFNSYKDRISYKNKSNSIEILFSIIFTFVIVTLLWIPFSAKDLSTAGVIISRLVTMADGVGYYHTWTLVYGLLILIVHVISFTKNNSNSIWRALDLHKFESKLVMCIFLILIFLFAYIGEFAFLYAQF